MHLEHPNRNALAVFSSHRCGSCRRVLTYLSQHPPMQHIFVIEAEEAMGLIEEFEIFHLPTLLLYKHGYFHANVTIHSPSDIANAIQRALSQPPQDEP
ncbi:MAG: thioredoxin family protein [Myxococcota bacterium]|nr:thioredoxin family protein [Myxococcota bacterium]